MVHLISHVTDFFFFFQAEDGIRDWSVTGVQTCALPISVARQIPNPRLVLVGHSMGAAVSLAATPLIGTRVIGVIAVEALRSVGLPPLSPSRSEERRVGKEWRPRGSAGHTRRRYE